MFNNKFLCLPQCIKLYCSWHTPIWINKNFLYVFHWYYFCNIWKIIHTNGYCLTWNFKIRISQQIIYYRNSKNVISFATCAYSWNTSLCQRTPWGIKTSEKTSWCFMLVWLCISDSIKFCTSNKIWILWRQSVCIHWRNCIIASQCFKPDKLTINIWGSVKLGSVSLLFIRWQKTRWCNNICTH